MKSSLILSLVFIIIGGILAYLQHNDSDVFMTLTFITGILLGTGIGMFLGSVIGYSSKAQSIKRKNKILKEKEKTMDSEIPNSGNI